MDTRNDITDNDGSVPPGIVVRTDYSTGSGDAWVAFCTALHDAERESFADKVSPTVTVRNGDGTDGEGSDDDASTDSDESTSSLALFAPLSGPPRFGNISNLRACYAWSARSGRRGWRQRGAAPAERAAGITGDVRRAGAHAADLRCALACRWVRVARQRGWGYRHVSE
jgi:hypothetical protein